MIKFSDCEAVAGYKIIRPEISVVRNSGLPQLAAGWCAWKAQNRPGASKPAKVPFAETGKISVSDEAAWLSFSDAVKLYQSNGYDGIGLLMSSSGHGGGLDLVGLDLDQCFDSDGEIVAGKESIVADFVAMGGYVEISPSGKGLRQFLEGFRLDEYRQKTTAQNLEVYDSTDIRYLTVTGHPYPLGSEAKPICKNQIRLEKFIIKWCDRVPEVASPSTNNSGHKGAKRSPEEIIALLKVRNKRGKLTRLLSGDISGYAGHSEADFALCCEIAYYTKNNEVIDAVFKKSGLMREKWNERRGKSTYGNMTIENARKAQSNFFDVDQIEEKTSKGAEAEKNQVEQAHADVNMVGGIADLRRGKAWRTDLYALTELLLRDKRLLGVCYWCEFSGYAILTRSLREVFADATAPDTVGKFTDCHYRAVVRWFGKEWKINVRFDQIVGIVISWSQKIRRNPVREMLDKLQIEWDGKPRLANWLIAYCAADCINEEERDISEYVRAVGTRWMLSVVARAMNPGCKADCMLILEGKQGARKSSAVRTLAESLGRDYFREGFGLGAGKDDRIALRGRVIVEWGELNGIGKRDREHLKNFLSQQTDSYRDVYGCAETDWPRTAVFCGTTNEGQYLSDPTGNRRFWPVKVGRIDIELLKINAPQIWGEAVALWKSNAIWWFDENDPRDVSIMRLASGEQERRIRGAVWDEVGADIAENLVCGLLPLMDSAEKARFTDHFSVNQLKAWLCGSVENAARVDDSMWLQMAEGLKRAGWRSRKISGRMRWQLSQEKCDDLCQRFDIANSSKSLLRKAAPKKQK